MSTDVRARGLSETPSSQPQAQQTAGTPGFSRIGIPAVAAAAEQMKRRAEDEARTSTVRELPPYLRDETQYS